MISSPLPAPDRGAVPKRRDAAAAAWLPRRDRQGRGTRARRRPAAASGMSGFATLTVDSEPGSAAAGPVPGAPRSNPAPHRPSH